MHQAIRMTVSLLLSAFILLGGSGLIIGKMVCLKSGHTVFAAKEIKDCCDTPETDFSVQAECCDISHVSFEQADFIREHEAFVKASPFTTIRIPADYISLLSAKMHEPVIAADPDIPPAYYGESPQIFLSIFRI